MVMVGDILGVTSGVAFKEDVISSNDCVMVTLPSSDEGILSSICLAQDVNVTQKYNY